MEVPRLGVELELQLPAYTTATAMPDPSLVCNQHCSSWQCQILNPLNEVRNPICILMVLDVFVTHWATMGTPVLYNLDYWLNSPLPLNHLQFSQIDLSQSFWTSIFLYVPIPILNTIFKCLPKYLLFIEKLSDQTRSLRISLSRNIPNDEFLKLHAYLMSLQLVFL